MNIKVKKVHDMAIIPTRGSKSAAGYDLHYCDNNTLLIRPGETKKLGTGVAYEIPDGYAGFVYARSGLSTKQGLRPANCVGVIDPDYRGEIMVALYNDSNETRIVNYGERIAQIVIKEYVDYNIVVESQLSETERGTGGFGSTGNK